MTSSPVPMRSSTSIIGGTAQYVVYMRWYSPKRRRCGVKVKSRLASSPGQYDRPRRRRTHNADTVAELTDVGRGECAREVEALAMPKPRAPHGRVTQPLLGPTLAEHALPRYCVGMKRPQSRLTAQGQISVPAEVRRLLGLSPGSVLEWVAEGDQVLVHRVGKHTFLDLHRVLFPDAPEPRTLDELDEGIRRHVRGRHARR